MSASATMIQFAATNPRFSPGDLVRHRRYGYRGVVVAVDPRCQANSDWYLSNRTQPDQNQPWCHVLVDGGGTTTYAAQSNLDEDSSAEPIDHPLVAEFFSEFTCGRYRRNDREWLGW
ncbi:MAG: heat shock protein HspQ [Planctomycetota bacterium]